MAALTRSGSTGRVLARRVLVAATLLLLLSFGGAIFAAPVTLPLLWMTVGAENASGWRRAAIVSLVLTAAEAAWGLAYVTAGEDSPLIWLLPLVVPIAILAAVLSRHRRQATPRSSLA